jgi:hypothetical protein
MCPDSQSSRRRDWLSGVRIAASDPSLARSRARTQGAGQDIGAAKVGAQALRAPAPVSMMMMGQLLGGRWVGWGFTKKALDGTVFSPQNRRVGRRCFNGRVFCRRGGRCSEVPTKKRPKLKHDLTCFNCLDGGNVVQCTVCPRVYHLPCAGLAEVPKGAPAVSILDAVHFD